MSRASPTTPRPRATGCRTSQTSTLWLAYRKPVSTEECFWWSGARCTLSEGRIAITWVLIFQVWDRTMFPRLPLLHTGEASSHHWCFHLILTPPWKIDTLPAASLQLSRAAKVQNWPDFTSKSPSSSCLNSLRIKVHRAQTVCLHCLYYWSDSSVLSEVS